MAEKDIYVEALRTLCDRKGGVEAVAAAAQVSPANLRQILAGVKLPSGNARGVGPELRKKLFAAFPLWVATDAGVKRVFSHPVPDEGLQSLGKAGDALWTLVSIFENYSEGTRGAAAALVAEAMRDPSKLVSMARKLDGLAEPEDTTRRQQNASESLMEKQRRKPKIETPIMRAQRLKETGTQ